jgi:transposase
MPTTYSEEFKKVAVEKMLNRGKRSIDEIAADLGGIHKATLVRWVKEFGTIPSMKLDESSSKGKRSQDYSAEEKLSALSEFRRLAADPSAQGEYLRKQGLYTPTLEAWVREALNALEIVTRRPKRSADEVQKDRKIVELERDLLRKDRALAETAALLVLKKKAESIWGLVDDEESA